MLDVHAELLIVNADGALLLHASVILHAILNCEGRLLHLRQDVAVKVGWSADDHLIILLGWWLVLFQESLGSKTSLLSIHQGLLLLLVQKRLLWWLVRDKYAVGPWYHLHQLTVRTHRHDRLRLRHKNRLGSKQGLG